MKESIRIAFRDINFYLGGKMSVAIRPWEKDADKFARQACIELTREQNKRLEDRVELIHRSGRLSAFERVLGDVERNPFWTLDTIKQGTREYLKALSWALAPLRLMPRPKPFQVFKTTYLEGEVLAARRLLNDFSDSDKVGDRNDTMAELHFRIIDENNDIVKKFHKGKEINVEFFTDRYLEYPEIFKL